MSVDQNTIQARFLLGKLSEDERSEVELEFLTDRAAFDELMIAEYSLLDAYITGELDNEDRHAFEQRMMATARQRNRVGFAEVLVRHATNETFGWQEIQAETAVRGPLTRLRDLLGSRFTLNFALAAACVLVVFGGAIWMSLPSRGINEVAQEVPVIPTAGPMTERIETPANTPFVAQATPSKVAELATKKPIEARPQRPEAAARPLPSAVATLVLPLMTTRGDGGTAFAVPENVSTVRLRLAPGEETRLHYFAVLETVDGQQIWSGKVKAAKRSSLGISVPGRALKTGDYIITVKGSDDGISFETIAEYSFTITRR